MLRYIYQIGDIHVHRQEREDEYKSQIRKLIDTIPESENAIIIIVGDIFDAGISPEAITIVKEMIIGLSEKSEVIVFRGNHDQASKTNKDAKDYIRPILSKLLTKNKITILEKTGSYEYENVVFGYTDVYDTEIYQIPESKKIKIGLWHGTINGAKTEVGEMNSKITKDDFKGYDYVLLGDIHKHQYITPTMAYCGSLIQQNYGESIENHGYIKWDIRKRKSQFIPIENDYGYVTIRVSNNKIIDKPEKIPKKINLRIKYTKCTEEYIKSIYNKIGKDQEILSYVEYKEQEEYMLNKIEDEKNSNEDVVKRLMDYIHENYDEKNITQEEKEKMKDILENILKDINYNFDTEKKMIKIKRLMFNNFNIYGGGNCIDYTKLKGVINVCGKNGIGKSSAVVYALLYAIYGYCEDTQVGRYDYINSKKRNMETQIILEVNGVEYRILRMSEFTHKDRLMTHFKHNVILYRNNEDISGKDLNTINKQIIEYIGSSDNLLNLCIMEQKRTATFLSLTDIEKKNYICSILKLDVYNIINDVLIRDAKINTLELTEKYKILYKDPKTKMISNIDDIEKEIEQKIEIKNNINLNKLEEEYKIINKKKIESEMKISELKNNEWEKIEKNEENNKKIKETEKIMEDIQIKINEIMENKEKLKKKRNKKIYDNVKEKNEEFEKEKEKKIKELNDELEKLLKQYVNIIQSDETIDELEKNFKKVMIELKENKDKLYKIKKEQETIQKDIDKYNSDKENKKGYEKYKEMIEKIGENDEKEKIILSKIDEIEKYISKNKKEYEKKIKQKETYTEIKNVVIEDLQKYINIEEEKHKFEQSKKERIENINGEIEKNLLKCEKERKEVDIQSLQEKKKIIEKENDKLNIGNDEKEIEKLTKKIVDVNMKKFEKNYEKFLEIRKEKELAEEKIESLKKHKKDLNKHYDLLKNHRYNEKCEICMSNDITKDKIETEKNINNMSLTFEKYIEEYNKIEEQYEQYKKYEIINKNIQENEKINNLIQEKQKKIEMNENKLALNKEKIKIIETQIDEYNKYLIGINETKNILINVNELKKQIIEIQNEQMEEYKKYLILKEKEEEINKNIERINKEVNEYEQKKEMLENYNKETEELVNIKDQTKQKYNKYIKYGETYEENNRNIERYNANKSLIQSLEKDIEIQTMIMETENKKMNEYKVYEKNKKQNEEITMKTKKIKEDISSKQKETYTLYDEYVNKLTEIKNYNSELQKYEIRQKNNEIQLIEYKTIYKEIIELIEKKAKYDDLTKYINIINKEYDTIYSNYKKVQEEYNDITTIETLKQRKEYLIQLKDECIPIEKKLLIKNKLIDIIKSGFVDNLLGKKIIPSFCDNVNNILKRFVKFNLDMEYNEKKVYVYKKEEDQRINVLKLSGYETLMANISIRLAINDINKLYKTNFFIIDEGFCYCDDESIIKIQQLFEHMKTMFNLILIVSHDERIKMYSDIDLPIQIKNKYSYVNNADEDDIFKQFMKKEDQRIEQEQLKQYRTIETQEKEKLKPKLRRIK